MSEYNWKSIHSTIKVSKENIEHAAKDAGYCNWYDYLNDTLKSFGGSLTIRKDCPAKTKAPRK